MKEDPSPEIAQLSKTGKEPEVGSSFSDIGTHLDRRIAEGLVIVGFSKERTGETIVTYRNFLP